MIDFDEFEPDDSILLCVDCGTNAWMQFEEGRVVHEDFYVQDDLWDSVCPDDNVVERVVDGTKVRNGRFVICIGCFEKRLGRRLTREDFTTGPADLFGTPPSRRFLARWGSGAGERT